MGAKRRRRNDKILMDYHSDGLCDAMMMVIAERGCHWTCSVAPRFRRKALSSIRISHGIAILWFYLSIFLSIHLRMALPSTICHLVGVVFRFGIGIRVKWPGVLCIRVESNSRRVETFRLFHFWVLLRRHTTRNYVLYDWRHCALGIHQSFTQSLIRLGSDFLRFAREKRIPKERKWLLERRHLTGDQGFPSKVKQIFRMPLKTCCSKTGNRNFKNGFPIKLFTLLAVSIIGLLKLDRISTPILKIFYENLQMHKNRKQIHGFWRSVHSDSLRQFCRALFIWIVLVSHFWQTFFIMFVAPASLAVISFGDK